MTEEIPQLSKVRPVRGPVSRYVVGSHKWHAAVCRERIAEWAEALHKVRAEYDVYPNYDNKQWPIIVMKSPFPPVPAIAPPRMKGGVMAAGSAGEPACPHAKNVVVDRELLEEWMAEERSIRDTLVRQARMAIETLEEIQSGEQIDTSEYDNPQQRLSAERINDSIRRQRLDAVSKLSKLMDTMEKHGLTLDHLGDVDIEDVDRDIKRMALHGNAQAQKLFLQREGKLLGGKEQSAVQVNILNVDPTRLGLSEREEYRLGLMDAAKDGPIVEADVVAPQED